jgi:hypothetical protein
MRNGFVLTTAIPISPQKQEIARFIYSHQIGLSASYLAGDEHFNIVVGHFKHLGK